MDGKGLLQRCCKDMDIDFESTFFYGESQVALHPGKRITQSYPSKNIEEKDYIVRYYPDNDIYFVWRHYRGRNSCGFRVPEDYSVEHGTIRIDRKWVGNSKTEQEPVYSFYSGDIKRFLEDIVAS